MRVRPEEARRWLSSLAGTVLAASVLAGLAAGGTTSRNGTFIAFTRWFPAARPPQIALIRADGGGLRAVRTDVVPASEPEWSPSGGRLLFRGGGTDDLYVIRPDGSGRRQLTHGRMHEQAAAWAPDGVRVAYQRWASGGASSIWVLRLTTGASVRLTRDSLGAGQPSWSPDGSRIAFVSVRAQRQYEPELWVMDADGSHPHHLFPALTGASRPAWSPEGRRLLITDGDQLYVIDAKSGHARVAIPLRSSPSGEKTDPMAEWSPDGTKIVFVQLGVKANPEIWVVDADGGHARRLIGAGPGVSGGTDPAWQSL